MNRRSLVVSLALLFALATAGLALAQTRSPAPRGGSAPPAAAKPAPRKEASKTGAGEGGTTAAGQRSNSPIVIDADRMEASKKDGLVIFTGNVVAKQDNSTQTADRMEVYLDDRGERVLRIVSTGNVKIVTEDCRTGTARRAEYYDDDQRLMLIGDAKVWQEDNVVTGDEIEMFLAEDRSTVKGGTRGRVKSVFYPKRDEAPADGATPAPKKDGTRPASCG
jgi:lipopolysaccharide export system protein LptA